MNFPPKNTAFEIVGDAAVATLVNIETGDELTLDVVFGHLIDTKEDSDTAGEVKGARYRVTGALPVMGREIDFLGAGTDIMKAVDSFMSEANLSDDFEITYDEEDEFFSQKAPTKAKPKADDVWGNPKFAANREQLEQMRGTVEGALTEAADSALGTQDANLKVAEMLVEVYGMVGNSRAALKNWALGATKADGENMQALAQLGSGVNALTEAMRLAQISKLEYGVLPVSITSGKGVDTFGRNSIRTLVAEAKVEAVMKAVNTTADIADIGGVEVLLRQFAVGVCGIQDALAGEGSYDVALTDLIEAVDGYAAEQLADFADKYGKSVNTYSKDGKFAAELAYGLARISTGGAGIFKAAVDAVEAYHATDDSEERSKLLEGLFIKTGGNAIIKEAYSTLKAHSETVKREEAARSAKQAADDLGDTVKPTAWADLDPVVAAQWLNTRIAKHGKPNEVAAALRGMLGDHAQTAPVAAAAE